MQYIKFTYGTGYCGEDGEDYVAFKNQRTDSQLDDWANWICNHNAEMYCDMDINAAVGDIEDYETEEEYFEAYEVEKAWYYENCYAEWETITEEEWKENNGYVED